MLKKYKVRTKYIDYCIEDGDIIDCFWPECQDWDEEQFEKKIDELRYELPQHLSFEIECEPELLECMVCEAISEETGWLVNIFSYDIIEEN